MNRTPFLLASLALLAASSSARAEDDLCPGGKTITPETKGHCCYPGQAWDGPSASCTGKPECPPKMTRDGYTCVPADPTEPPAPATVKPSGVDPVPPVTPPAAAAPPPQEPAPPPAEDSSPRKTMFTWGVVSLSVGYGIAAISAVVGSILHASDNGKYGASCASGAAWSFMPLAGPFVTLANYPRYQIATRSNMLDCNGGIGAVTALVVTSEVLQLAGAGLIGVSFALPAKRDTTRGQITLTPGTSAGIAGLSLSVTGL